MSEQTHIPEEFKLWPFLRWFARRYMFFYILYFVFYWMHTQLIGSFNQTIEDYLLLALPIGFIMIFPAAVISASGPTYH